MILTAILLFVVSMWEIITYWMTKRFVIKHNASASIFNQKELKQSVEIRYWFSLVVFALCAGVIYNEFL